MEEIDELAAQGRKLLHLTDRVLADQQFCRWDNDVGEWLSESFPDSGSSARWSSLKIYRLVYDNCIGSSEYDWIEFREAVQERLKWLSELREIGKSSGLGPTTTSVGLELPEKVTLAWLWKNVPAKYGITLVVIIFTAFAFGTKIGQLSSMQEFYSTKPEGNIPTSKIASISIPRKVILSNGQIDLSGPGSYLLDTEGGAGSDDLIRINGLKKGEEAILSAVSSERTIVVKKSPYLKMSYKFYLNNEDDRIKFVGNGVNICSEISRSSND